MTGGQVVGGGGSGGRRRPSRRSVLVVAVGGTVVAGSAAARTVAGRRADAVPAPAPPPAAVGLRPVSMAMHIHGSFSEGTASYEAHLQQAREHGVDVIWWTDHDFRVAAHGYRTQIGFDDLTEVENGMEWSWSEQREGELAEAAAEFVTEPRAADEPGRAMRLTARSAGEFAVLWYHATAWNWTYSVSLADTTLEIDVLAEDVGPGRELVIELMMSYHPARAGRPAGRYVLQYRFGGVTEPASRQDGLRGLVEAPLTTGGWHRHRLRPVDDIAAIWPDLVAADNSLHQLRIGVRAAADRATRVVVDRLRFDRGQGDSDGGIGLRRSVLEGYRDEYPDVVHYESFEVSLVRHLNWIGGELTMPPFPEQPRRTNDPDRTAEMIRFMRSHGAMVQWCHPLDSGGGSPEELLALMIERNSMGAELMEIGREPYDDLRLVFDTAARNGLFITGVGVSDDHGGRDWLDQRDNNLTCVWAESTGQDALIAALRAGRAWWVNPARWRGTLDVAVQGRAALGGVLLTDTGAVDVRITATDLPAGSTLVIVESPVDYAGAASAGSPVTRHLDVPADQLVGGAYEHRVEPGEGSYLRLQVRDSSGIVGESNPLWMLREPPPHGIPGERLLDV